MSTLVDRTLFDLEVEAHKNGGAIAFTSLLTALEAVGKSSGMYGDGVARLASQASTCLTVLAARASIDIENAEVTWK